MQNLYCAASWSLKTLTALLFLLTATLATSGWSAPHCINPTCQNKRAAKLSTCKGCHEATYCSTDCQKAHWPVHKSPCTDFKKVRDANPQLPLTQQTKLVEIRSTDSENGLYSTAFIPKGTVFAHYWGNQQPDRILRAWHPTLAGTATGVALIGERSEFIQDRPYLGAQFANDNSLSFEHGTFLLTVDPILDGQLNQEIAQKIITLILDAAENKTPPTAQMMSDTITGTISLRATQDIPANTEITLHYGSRYWIEAILTQLSFRGYFFENIELLHLLHQQSHLRFKNQPFIIASLKENLNQMWYDDALFQQIQRAQLSSTGKILEQFSALFGLQGAHTILQLPFDIDALKFPFLKFLQGAHAKASGLFWKNQLFKSVMPTEQQNMDALVQKLRNLDPEEFTRSIRQADGSYKPHPLAIQFLIKNPVYFFDLDLKKESDLPKYYNSQQLLEDLKKGN